MLGVFTSQAFNSQLPIDLPIASVNTIEFSGQSPATSVAAPVSESFLLDEDTAPTSTWVYLGLGALAAIWLFDSIKRHR